jgi:hypothetical protein
MDVSDDIVVVLVPVHKSQMVHVSLLVWIHTLTHGDTVTLYYCCQACDCFLPHRYEYCCVRWLETQMMKMIRFEFKLQKKFVSWIGIYKKEDLNVWWSIMTLSTWHPIKIAYIDHVLLQYQRTTAFKFLLHQYKEAYAKALQPKPCGSCLPRRCKMPGGMSDMCRWWKYLLWQRQCSTA